MTGSFAQFKFMKWKDIAYGLCLCFLLYPGIATPEIPTSQPSRYTVAVIPFYSPEKIWFLYTPFIQYLKSTTGLPWELKFYPDHNSLIDELCTDKVGFALLGPVPMGRAYNKCGAKPVLVAVGKDGKPSYHSVIVTSDPAVTALSKVRGRKFGFFKGSTAAHIVPLSMLKNEGLGPEDLQPVFFESQDRIMTALLASEISAAGVKKTLYQKFENEPLRVLKTSDPLPNFAFCVAPSMPAAIRERFISALRKLQPLSDNKDAEITKAWDDEIKNGFILPAEDYLASVLKLHNIFLEIVHEDR
jgi:ABC-type phosphate/phosphonate transport system substrate-binding protein